MSAANGEGTPELISLIKNAVQNMPEVGRKLPKPWNQVKESLKTLAATEKSISYQRYQMICDQERLSDVSETSEQSLLSFLHDCGGLYYKEGVFQNEIILDQKWAIEAIYTIFDRNQIYYQLVEKGRGRFTRQELEKWVWNKYSKEEQEVFLSIMESCELCFRYYDYSIKDYVYIAPQLLPPILPNQKNLYWDEGGINLLYFIYEHQFFHKGILDRFIARIGELAGNDALYFSNFIVFQDLKTQTKTLIEYLPLENQLSSLGGRILIKVKGRNSKELLDKVRNEFEQLNVNATVKELVSTNGIDFVELEFVKENYENGIKQVLSQQKNSVNTEDFEIFFTKTTDDSLSQSYKETNAKGLVVMKKAGKQGKDVFISYFHQNTEWLDKLKVHLDAILHITDQIDVWDDRRIGAGAKWKEEISTALDSAKIGILLISKEFLASEFIRNEELPRLLKSATDKGLKLLILLINQSSFKLIPQLSQYQTINPPDRLLSTLDENEQDVYFVKVVEEVISVLGPRN